MNINLHSILRQQFGYEQFRPGQEDVIRSVLTRKDTIAILPTGNGKSLCYQLPTYVLGGQTLVISPLVALMEDQVMNIRKRGEKKVVAFNSFLPRDEREFAFMHLHHYRFIFISPEMFYQSTIQSRILALDLSLIVVDEAHCISQWGFDFRPDYLRIGEVWGDQQKRPPILALTATANEQVMSDITHYLQMTKPTIVKHSIDRPNIAYEVVHVQSMEEKTDWLRQRLKQTTGPGIIYVGSRKRADDLANQLQQTGIHIQSYHAGKEQDERSLLQSQFLLGELDWICATNAFGMGIDKADIRQVIHEHVPAQLAAYVQEVGRAGRDGKQAIATLLYVKGDEQFTRFIIQSDLPSEEQLTRYLHLLQEGQSRTEAMTHAGLSETAVRVIQYYETQHGDTQEITRHLSQLKQLKEQQLQPMIHLVQTNECLRKWIVTQFDEVLRDRPFNCCSNCQNLNFEWLQNTQSDQQQPREESWEARIDQLLS